MMKSSSAGDSLFRKLAVEWCTFGCVFCVTLYLYLTTGQTTSTSPAQVTVHTQKSDCPEAPRIMVSSSSAKNHVMCSNEVRQRHLENVCNQWKTTRHIRFQDPGSYWALLVDDRHRILYCILPKAGCTSIQTMIVNSTGQLHTTNEMDVHDPLILEQLNFKYLHQYPFEEIIWRLEHYFKFLVTRHPLERLFSAYEDKIKTDYQFTKRFASIIHKHFPDFDTETRNQSLSLQQFLELVAAEYDIGYKDRHWAMYDEICHPCDIKFDYIAKLETITEDFQHLLPRLTSEKGDNPQLPKLHSTTKGGAKESLEAFKSVAPSTMRRIHSLYKKDFDLFGYNWDNNSYSNCDVVDGDGHCC